jgi:hypothetical protein
LVLLFVERLLDECPEAEVLNFFFFSVVFADDGFGKFYHRLLNFPFSHILHIHHIGKLLVHLREVLLLFAAPSAKVRVEPVHPF